MGKKFWLMVAAYIVCTWLALMLFVGGVVVPAFHWLETNGAKTLWDGKK